jgi:hypothetical protein
MFKSDSDEKSMSPILLINGLLLAVAGGILIHVAVISSVGGWMSQAEGIIGLVAQYGGIALLIVPLVLIGSMFKGRKNEINTAIILLVLFIGADLAKNFYPEMILWGGGWGGMAVFLVYGIIRGIAFMKVNRGLEIPARGYGNAFFNIYGWSFFVTFLVYFILSIISLYAFIPILFTIAIYILIAQSYIDGVSLVIVGLKFLIDASNKPTIASKRLDYAPVTPTGAGETLYQPAKPIQAEESVIKYCTYCGAQNFEGGKFCDNCGQALV